MIHCFEKFFHLCSKLMITKTEHLGWRNNSKLSPILACFIDVSMKNMILSYSGKYKNVYIASDRTKIERHQKLVEELKWRSNGEHNLVICNGSIIVSTCQCFVILYTLALYVDTIVLVVTQKVESHLALTR